MQTYPWGMPTLLLSATIDALPWQPISPGFDLKVIHGSSSDDDTRVLLLRLAPGTTVARHRHGGEVHALNLAGTREILDTGKVIGPGGYEYEPPGTVDSWRAIGDVPVVVFATIRGALEYLDEHGNALSCSTTRSVSEAYRHFAASDARPHA